MSDKLPDCMMPDGGDPCEGYSQLSRRIAKLEAENEQLRILAWQCCFALNAVWDAWNRGGRLTDAVRRVEGALDRFKIPTPDYMRDPKDRT